MADHSSNQRNSSKKSDANPVLRAARIANRQGYFFDFAAGLFSIELQEDAPQEIISGRRVVGRLISQLAGSHGWKQGALETLLREHGAQLSDAAPRS